jgi:aspartate-semialdehyde dehydrogenase
MNKRDASLISMKAVTVGVVGATGAVGKEIVDCLNKSTLDVSKLRIFGSQRSAGTTRDAGKFGEVPVELFDVAAARECDVVFLAVSGDFALEHAKAISEGEGGAVVIDNSSAFRYDEDIPLVVPEINGECTKGAKLIANPNCTTAIGLMALWPLHKLFKLKRVMMSVSYYDTFKCNNFSHHSSDCILKGTNNKCCLADLPSSFWSRTGRNGRT